LLSRDKKISLNEALDRIACEEGFAQWSLLASHLAQVSPSRAILAGLENGDLLLLGARPGHGKTTMGLQLLLDAAGGGQRGIFFTLFMSEREVAEHLRSLASEPARIDDLVSIVTSDDISSDFIMRYMGGASPGTVAVVDYLQLLDERRSKPHLSIQISALKRFARETGVVLIFLSQIDRSYDSAVKPLPDIQDIRLPNRVDPKIFSKTCFLHNGELQIQATA
jgi:replicative DNA helicase